MREIIYRAWNVKGKRWATCVELLTVVPVSATMIGSPFCSVKLGKDDDEWVFQQYTQLKDKNGKELYEGDIVKVTRTNWYCPGHPKHNTDLVDRGEIYWDEERNSMAVRTFDFERLRRNPNQRPYSSSGYLGNWWNDERADENIVEIIGNIYENPELLTK